MSWYNNIVNYHLIIERYYIYIPCLVSINLTVTLLIR